jgi:hypothetical protein
MPDTFLPGINVAVLHQETTEKWHYFTRKSTIQTPIRFDLKPLADAKPPPQGHPKQIWAGTRTMFKDLIPKGFFDERGVVGVTSTRGPAPGVTFEEKFFSFFY